MVSRTQAATAGMAGWSLQPIFGGYAAPLAVVAVLALLAATRPRFGRLNLARRLTIAVLRGLVILLLAVAMLRPTLTWSTVKEQTATLVLLLDQSRSMQLPHATGGVSRWEAQRAALDRLAPELDRLGEKMIVKAYAYDRQLAPLEVAAGRIRYPAAPEGRETDIGSTLADAVEREAGQRLAGVILLGDGVQTALAPRVELQYAARELGRLGYPLYTVPFGPEGDAARSRDVAVENLQDQYSVFVKTELAVRAAVRVQGYVGQPIPVTLTVEDAAGRSQTLPPQEALVRDDGAQAVVEFRFTPQQVGQYTLVVEAAEQPGELTTKNNRLTAFLAVREGGLKVLYLRGASWFEQKFVRRSLGQSADIEIEDRLLESRLRSRWPLDLTAALAAGDYDVFIFDDLDAAALHRPGGQEQNLALIAAAVERGAGLAMIGGRHSFGPGGYADTPLARLLPIDMELLERQDFDAPLREDVHLRGPLRLELARPHFITRLQRSAGENDQFWRQLRPAPGANRFVGVKDRAQVLVQSSTAEPLLVTGDYGRGRVAALALDSTYTWWGQGFADEHKRFWRQLVLWLARRDEDQRDEVWLQLASRRLPLGGRLEATAGARSPAGDPLTDIAVRLEVSAPDGSARSTALARDGERYVGAISELSPPGRYDVTAIATRGDVELGRAASQFEVFDRDLELSTPAADRAQLARLADLTAEAGGRLVAAEELPELLREIAARPPEQAIEIESRWRLADTALDAWLVLLAFAGLLTTEWALRKRWGLV